MRSIKMAKRVTIASVIFSLTMLVGFVAFTVSNLKVNTARADQYITLTKTASPTEVDTGDPRVWYTYTITNESNQTILGIVLTDDQIPSPVGTCPTASSPWTLTAHTSNTCWVGPITINQDTTNTATVIGAMGDAQTRVSASDTTTATIVSPTLNVTKTANPTAITADDTVTYTVSITNTSPVSKITLESLTDSIYGDLNGVGNCQVDENTTIDPGATYTCEFTEEVTCADEPSVTDTVTATATYTDITGEGHQISGSDDATVDIACEEPSMTVTKTANPTAITEDTEVDYEISITNSLGFDATISSLVDNVYGNLNNQGDCKVDSEVKAGETYTCTFPGEVTCKDEPSLTDTVTAELTYTDTVTGREYTNSDEASATVDVACENNNEEPGSAIIHGKVYNDANQNKTLDVGESGIADVTVALRDEHDTTLSTSQTDSNGEFTFNELDPGTYALRETDPEGYSSSTTNDISNIEIAANDSSYHVFGDYQTEEQEVTVPTTTPIAPTPTITTTTTTTSALPTTGPGDNPYPLFAALALVPLIASGYAFYRYKRK